MPASDYASAVGGALKFKGGSKITKVRKKVRPKPEQADSGTACDTSAFDVNTEPDGDEPTDAATATTTATPEKPPTTRRTSSQTDADGTPRRRATLDGPPPAADPPSRERIASPDARYGERAWHATPPRRADTAREEENGSERSLAGALRSAGWRAETEAERRAEERRRRRIEDRVRREGTKTHKERVEEFNARLAALSEHHDMPRIGPG